MVNTYTKEQKTVQLTEHFTVGDFWAYSGHEEIKLDTALAEIWEKFYEHFGVKPQLRTYNGKVVKSAGFRNDQNPAGAKGSQHYLGKATDMELPGVPAYLLAQYAETLPEIGGIGLYQHPDYEAINVVEHIHIDTRSRKTPARWGWDGDYSGCNIPTFGGVYAAIRKGHRGVAVRLIQRYLSAQGYACGADDGIFGVKVDAALRAWQKANGLIPDGVYGKKSNAITGLFEW